jgi:Tfp pilus assembly protein PilF
MRITLPSLALSCFFAMVSSSAYSQGAQQSNNPRSIAFANAGDAALAQPDQANEAIDDYETALALDPQNRAALLGLARAAMVQGLPGKAVHFYRAALALAPNDVNALEGQGEALVAKGALLRANDNLAKIKALCVGACPQQVALSAALAKASTTPVVTAAQIKSNPTVTEDNSSANN